MQILRPPRDLILSIPFGSRPSLKPADENEWINERTCKSTLEPSLGLACGLTVTN